MKQEKKAVTGFDVAFVGGMCWGMVVMFLTWWAGTGMQHPGLVIGGGIMLIVAAIGGRYTKRKAKR